jgi:hypothetical protein
MHIVLYLSGFNCYLRVLLYYFVFGIIILMRPLCLTSVKERPRSDTVFSFVGVGHLSDDGQ